MEPILDETSLAPCGESTPAARIERLAATLRALDAQGLPPVLRSVRDAADRDIGDGHGLRFWCFQPANRDAGRLVALRLGRPPHVDGAGGLFQTAEGQRAIQAEARGRPALGLGVAALTDAAAVALRSEAIPSGGPVAVRLDGMDEHGEFTEQVDVPCFVGEDEVGPWTDWLVERVDRRLADGRALLEHAPTVFPHLRFGAEALRQLRALTGNEPVYRQLLRHLRALDRGARQWPADDAFAPAGALKWSPESQQTLHHDRYGPMRSFPAPDGFSAARWSLHTKLTGGAGARLYFRPERTKEGGRVLIGYFGPHLPSVEYPT